MISGSFARLATVTASTKRMGAVAAGLSGDLAVSIATLKCTPLDPVTPEVAAMVGLGNFAELLVTYCEGGLDILEGDELTSGGVAYEVRAVGEWHWRPTDSNTLAVVLEEAK